MEDIIFKMCNVLKYFNSQQLVEIRLAVTEVNFCSMLTSQNLLTSKKCAYKKYKQSFHMVVSLAGDQLLIFSCTLLTVIMQFACVFM